MKVRFEARVRVGESAAAREGGSGSSEKTGRAEVEARGIRLPSSTGVGPAVAEEEGKWSARAMVGVKSAGRMSGMMAASLRALRMLSAPRRCGPRVVWKAGEIGAAAEKGGEGRRRAQRVARRTRKMEPGMIFALDLEVGFLVARELIE